MNPLVVPAIGVVLLLLGVSFDALVALSRWVPA